MPEAVPEPQPTDDAPMDLTTQLKAVEAGVKKLLASGLTRQAVVVLLEHDTKLSTQTIDRVLRAVTNLSHWTQPTGASR